MADIIDSANDQAEMILARELQARRPTGPAATGACLACAEPLPRTHRWCDSDCRADYERIECAARRNGRSAA